MTTYNISIIGVPTDYGQTRRGVDMGPSAIRYAGVEERLAEAGHVIVDEGNINIKPKQDENERLNVFKYTLEEIKQMIIDGKIDDSKTIALMYRLENE